MSRTPHPRRDGLASWLPAGLLSILVAAAALGSRAPVPGGPVALVYPPWWPARRAIEAAAGAGSFVRLGPWPGVIVVLPAPGADDGGAWFRLDPLGRGLCGDAR